MESSAANTEVTATPAPHPRAADWFWRPWYAKLWWTTIAVWWLGMAGSLKIAPLSEFYASALAGYLNLLFYPVTALIVLGVGWMRKLLEQLSLGAPDGAELDDAVLLQMRQARERHWEVVNRLNAATDIYDPRSGTLYIGNSISPNNGARINAS